ncbi:MAG: fibronectin type III domain-containing protein [Opitutales bacterium]
MIQSRFLGTVCVSFLILCAQAALAVVPPVAPTFPNAPDDPFNYIPGQLLVIDRYDGTGPVASGNTDRPTNIIYHNGFIYANTVGGRDQREWTWSNSNDITSFFETAQSGNLPLFNDQGNHANTKVGDWFGGSFDMAIQRIGVNQNGYGRDFRIPSDQVWRPSTPPEATGGIIRMYYPWSVAFNWAYGSHNGQTFIYKRDELLANWNALSESGVSGTTILVGDLCFIISDQSRTGVLAYDMSPIFQDPPGDPILLDKLSGDFGAYLPVLWENYILFARNNGDTLMDVVDWSDPTDLKFVTSIDLARDGNDGPSNVPYIQAQDNFVFARHHKVNMDTFQVDLKFDQTGNNRPAGSLTDQLETSQYMMPLGRFIISGSYSFADYDGLGVWVHQAEPDTRRPYVGYHRPRPGQTNFPLGAPISLLIHETLESYTIINGETLIVRPVGGDPIDCYTSFSHDDILTITPVNDLLPDTTYEVIVVDGGIKDAAGNGIEPYSFTFSTGSGIAGGNQAPVINQVTANPSPIQPGNAIAFSVDASDDESDPLEYRYNFGDGTASTEWTTDSTISHLYPNAGHFEVKVQVRDLKPGGATSNAVLTLTVTVTDIPSGPFPTKSGPIALDGAACRVYTVNPDNSTLTAMDADTLAVLWEVPTGTDPRSVAVDSAGKVWVSCYDTGFIDIFNGADGGLIQSLDAGYGSAPFGVCATADGAQIFVTLEGYGDLVRFDALTMTETARLNLGPWAHAIAIYGDGDKLLVSRFLSPLHFGVIWEVENNPTSLVLSDTIELYRDRGDRGTDGASAGSGVPNYISSITISPDEAWAFYTAKKDDTQRGEFFDLGTGNNAPLEPDHTVRALVGRIDLSNNKEPAISGEQDDHIRLDVDNSEGPTAVEFSPLGDWIFTALRGNNLVAIYDHLHLLGGGSENTFARIDAGKAPLGLVIDPATSRLWIKNYMSRDVTLHELADFFATGDRTYTITTISTVGGPEILDPQVLLGKQIFYDAGNSGDGNSLERMSLESYMSCATCHIDGSFDGRTFDFTQRGEGLRNTTDLRARGGMAHGNVHWSANFDEIQDFENDVRLHFGGAGFMTDTDFAETQDPLGAAKTGRSSDLDALAAYVTSLDVTSLPQSPYRNADGTLTAAALRGSAIFQAESCATCHVPAGGYTDSTGGIGVAVLLHDIGTLRTSSGQRLDGPLTGIDTPSLLGVWQTEPYFHDGSAQTLADVFTVAGGVIYQAEDGTLNGASVPNFININRDSACHGAEVDVDPGETVTFSNVDGGSGGTGALEFRVRTSDNNVTLRATVNGTPHEAPVPESVTRLEYYNVRIEGVSLLAGATNTIVVTALGDRHTLDEMIVSTADALALAQPHRRVLTLSQGDQDDLLAYLLELDGRDASGDLTVPEPLPILDPPLAPLSLEATSDGSTHSIRVAFADGSTNETEFIVRFRQQGATVWFLAGELGRTDTGSIVTMTLTGLEASTTYEIQALARNAIGDSPVTAIVSATTAAEAVQPSLTAQLRYNVWDQSPTVSSLDDYSLLGDPDVDGTIDFFDISEFDGTTQYIYRFWGLIEIQTPGVYTFYTASDDGSNLLIEDTLVVDNGDFHGTQERSGTYEFTQAGFYRIEVGYFQGGSGDALTVSYAGPGLSKQEIPASVLFHDPSQSALPIILPDPGPFIPGVPVLTRTSPTSIDVSFLDQSDNETDFRLFYQAVGSGLFSQMVLPAADGTGDAVTVSLTGLLPDTSYQVRVQARNGFASSPYTPFATLSLSPFAQWQLANFSEAEIAAGLANPDATPDGTTYSVLTQFFYGMNPRVDDLPLEPFKLILDGDTITGTFGRAAAASEVDWTLMQATVLDDTGFAPVADEHCNEAPTVAFTGPEGVEMERISFSLQNPPYGVSDAVQRFFYLELLLTLPE